MNYIKKKINKHKLANRNHDDDDVYDYIPAVPPHPSELGKFPPVSAGEEELNGLSEEEAKARLEKLQQIEEANRKKEESKKSQEAWKFFEQLNQRVTDTVSKTQTVIDTLKDSTTADELTKQAEEELGFAAPESPESAVDDFGATFEPGSWATFEEGAGIDDLPVKVKSPEEESKGKTPVDPSIPPIPVSTEPIYPEPVPVDLSSDNFGADFDTAFAVPLEEEGDDPFDTSYVSVSLVEAKTAAKVITSSDSSSKDSKAPPVVVNGSQNKDYSLVETRNLDLEHQKYKAENRTESETKKTVIEKPQPPVSSSVSPGLTSSISEVSSSITPEVPSVSPDTLPAGDPVPDPDFDVDVTDLYLQQSKKLHTSRYGSTASLASILSNPFLNEDFTDDYNPPITPYSGSATPTKARRGSTNPFEESSPTEEVVTASAASAIAALTADFCSAVGGSDDAFIPNNTTTATSTTTTTAVTTTSQDYNSYTTTPASSTLRSASEVPSTTTLSKSTSQKNKFLSSASVEVAESSTLPISVSGETFDPFATIVPDDIHEEEVDVEATKVTAADNDYLTTADKNPDYPSDISDIEDPELAYHNDYSTTATNEDNNVVTMSGEQDHPQVPESDAGQDQQPEERRRSSAFNAKEDTQTPSKRSSTSSVETSRRRSSSKPFDPFQQVDERDAPVTPISTDKRHSFPEKEEPGHAAEQETLDNEGGEKNPPETQGVVNEAFEDYPPPANESDTTSAQNDVNAKHDGGYDDESRKTQEDESFPPPPTELDIPDFSDPTIDPFDTSFLEPGAKDEFSDRFDNTSGRRTSGKGVEDAFSSPLPGRKNTEGAGGFGQSGFDPYSGTRPPTSTPRKMKKADSNDSSSDDDNEEHFKIVIKAKMRDPAMTNANDNLPMPLIPPPPKTPTKSRESRAKQEFDENEYQQRKAALREERDRAAKIAAARRAAEIRAYAERMEKEAVPPPALRESGVKRGDSTESPSTPLYDDDISQPLEEFPKKYQGDGWEMYIRYPAKKKITGNRFWKKIFVRVSENSVVQLFNKREETEPFQELPLQPSYSMSEISAQQYDQFGKIFTVKIQYVFFRERVGVRKGQIAKVMDVMQGQIASIGSLSKLGMPLDHAPQVSELIKLGTQSYQDARDLLLVVEEALFRMPLHRDRALSYKTEEIQITVQDDYYVEQNRMGIITKQLARVRVFFVAFLNGMPGVEIGVNDLTRQGKEVVGRHDIIPVVTEEWIRVENYEFHSCVMVDEFDKTRTIKLIPPDACYFELMRFRIRPPKNRELPLQVSCNLYITKRKVELRCEVLVPGAVSRKHGQIPCEDIMIRIHIPECWIYFFRTEKHMRYGAVKSTARRPGKLKVHKCAYFPPTFRKSI